MFLLATRAARGGQMRLKVKACITAVVNNNTNFTQAATITSAGGKPRERPSKPFDYRRKKFTFFHQPFDRTLARMDENSKVIVVDGPMASGKNEFAKKLAHELDFKFVPQPNMEKEMYKLVDGEGLLYGDIADVVEPERRLYDLKSFYEDPAPTLAEGNNKAGVLQMDYFITRLFTYNDALLHLYSTGQGVVCVRSPWTDRVFAKALRENGFISKIGFNYYSDEVAKHHLVDFPRPHLVIYLDADVEETKANIKRRNNELEINSKVLTDGYLQSIENEYKDVVLPALEDHGELLVYPSIPNITEHEIALMVEDIEALGPMEHTGISDDNRLSDWSNLRDEELAWRRRDHQDQKTAMLAFAHERPWHAPEMFRDTEVDLYQSSFHQHIIADDNCFDTPTLRKWYHGMVKKETTDRRHFFVPA